MRKLGMAALLLVLGCRSAKPPGLLPETGEAAGWSKAGQTRTFEAGNLWQYLDGGAEKYVQAGVEKTVTADYRYRDGTEATADIHVMQAAAGAGRILESEPAAGSEPVGLGDEGRLYGASLTFRKGRYLVRLVAYQQAPQTGSALVALGRSIEIKLGAQS